MKRMIRTMLVAVVMAGAWTSLAGGADGFRSPAEVAADQVAKAAEANKAAEDAAAASAAAQQAVRDATAAEQVATKRLDEANRALAAAKKAAGDGKDAAAAETVVMAEEQAKWARDAVDKAKAARTAAQKDASSKANAANAAADKAALLALAAARAELEKVIAARTEAERNLSAKERAVTEATRAITPLRTAADKASKEQAQSDTGRQQAEASGDAAKLESAKKSLEAKVAAAKGALDKLAAAQKQLDTAEAEKQQAAKALAEATAAVAPAERHVSIVEAKSLGGLTPLKPDQWTADKAEHLLRRAGFGGTAEEVAKLHAMGLHNAVDFLVDYHNQPPYVLAYAGTLPPRPSPDERYRSSEERQMLSQQRMRDDRAQIRQLRAWWMQRMIESPRPLEEKLVLFWHNHFSTEYRTVDRAYLMYQQNELLREHASGNFGALLRGITHDAAMLRYLDNNRNVKGKPNENLAREIMELFSMGEGNGYTEKDIMEAARALTGYTYDSYACQFRYIASSHDNDNKTIFGRTGNFAGDDVVDLILQQAATSRFIARKLWVYFAYDNPDQETVERLATMLRRNEYNLGPVLKNLFLSQEFYSDRAMGTQIKAPADLAIGTMRTLGVRHVDYGLLENALRAMEQDLFDPPSVKGWEGGRNWVNTNLLFVRYNQLADLIERTPRADAQRGIDVIATLGSRQFKTAGEVVDHLASALFAQPLAADKRQELIEFLGDLPPSDQWSGQAEIHNRLRALVVLMVTMPEYQVG